MQTVISLRCFVNVRKWFSTFTLILWGHKSQCDRLMGDVYNKSTNTHTSKRNHVNSKNSCSQFWFKTPSRTLEPGKILRTVKDKRGHLLRLTSKLGVDLVDKLLVNSHDLPALVLLQARHAPVGHGLGWGARAGIGHACLGSIGGHRCWSEAAVGDARPKNKIGHSSRSSSNQRSKKLLTRGVCLSQFWKIDKRQTDR